MVIYVGAYKTPTTGFSLQTGSTMLHRYFTPISVNPLGEFAFGQHYETFIYV